MTWSLIWSYWLCETMLLLTSSFFARYGRPSTIFCAVASPTPGNVANSSFVALLRSIFLLEELLSPVTAFLVFRAAFFVPSAVAEPTSLAVSAVALPASFASDFSLLLRLFLVVVVLWSVLDWSLEVL